MAPAVARGPLTLLAPGQTARGTTLMLPAARTDEADDQGWWKLDAADRLLTGLDASEITWVDPELDDEDELGIPYRELVTDWAAGRGVAITFDLGDAKVATAEAALAPAPEADSGPASAPAPIAEAADAPEPVTAPPARAKKKVTPKVVDGDFEEPKRRATVYDDEF